MCYVVGDWNVVVVVAWPVYMVCLELVKKFGVWNYGFTGFKAFMMILSSFLRVPLLKAIGTVEQ